MPHCIKHTFTRVLTEVHSFSDRRRFTVEEQTLANQLSELRRETIIIPNGDKKSPVCVILFQNQKNVAREIARNENKTRIGSASHFKNVAVI